MDVIGRAKRRRRTVGAKGSRALLVTRSVKAICEGGKQKKNTERDETQKKRGLNRGEARSGRLDLVRDTTMTHTRPILDDFIFPLPLKPVSFPRSSFPTRLLPSALYSYSSKFSLLVRDHFFLSRIPLRSSPPQCTLEAHVCLAPFSRYPHSPPLSSYPPSTVTSPLASSSSHSSHRYLSFHPSFTCYP
jgi:hypothetical protein